MLTALGEDGALSYIGKPKAESPADRWLAVLKKLAA
jgi:hypothetical protein